MAKKSTLVCYLGMSSEKEKEQVQGNAISAKARKRLETDLHGDRRSRSLVRNAGRHEPFWNKSSLVELTKSFFILERYKVSVSEPDAFDSPKA